MRSLPSFWSNLVTKFDLQQKRKLGKASINIQSRKLRFEQCEERRVLATYTVNVAYDAVAPFDFGDQDVSLREAIELANQDDLPDTILFDSSSLDGQTITLGIDDMGNSLNLGINGDLDITEAVTIDAEGSDITIDASGNDLTPNSTLDDGDSTNDGDGSNVFSISLFGGTSTSEVLLKGLKLTGGDSRANAGGGAIYFNGRLQISGGGGILTIEDSHIYENYADSTGGGAVFAERGVLNIHNSVIENNAAEENGGGVKVRFNMASATITDTQFKNNSADNYGGGLFIDSFLFDNGPGLQAGEFVIERSIFENNVALDANGDDSGDGGAIYADLGGSGEDGGLFPSLTIVETVFDDNTAFRDGGGLWACTKYGATLDITDSTFSANQAGNVPEFGDPEGQGGGVWVGVRVVADDVLFDVTLDRVTIANNYSEVDGGGMWIGFTEALGPLSGSEQIVTDLQHVTVSGNTANGQGGGLWIGHDTEIQPDPGAPGDIITDLNHVTIFDNRAPEGGAIHSAPDGAGNAWLVTTTLNNTIASGNIVSDSNSTASNISGEIELTSEYNLLGSNAGNYSGLPTTGSPRFNLHSDNPNLAPLMKNGGLTLTHAPNSGSAAIDAGDPSFTAPPTFDQRGSGFHRVYNNPNATGNAIDIGAVELQAPKVIGVAIGGPNTSDGNRTNGGNGFYDIPVGDGRQIRTVPIGGADILEVTFSRPVDASTLTATGAFEIENVFTSTFYTASFDFVGTSGNTATWEFTSLVLNDRIPTGQYELRLLNSVLDLDGDALDGEWDNPVFSTTDPNDPNYDPSSVFPSGDGTAGTVGGVFEFYFTILEGDTDTDNDVDIADLGTVAGGLAIGFGDWIDGNFDGDSDIDIADLGTVAFYLGSDLTTWPGAIQAVSGGGGSSSLSYESATDVAFSNFDANQDGKLNLEEFEDLFKHFGIEIDLSGLA